jgi:hypothetical protein
LQEKVNNNHTTDGAATLPKIINLMLGFLTIQQVIFQTARVFFKVAFTFATFNSLHLIVGNNTF